VKIGFIGRSELCMRTIDQAIKKGHECAFIITAKEAPEYQVGSNDFKSLAAQIECPFLHKPNVSAKNVLTLCDGELPVLVISVNYTGVISEEIVSLFSMGILNAHGGDLPRYRGNACQAWALINGEEEIGLCIHKMIGGELDSGDIIEREYFPTDINTKIGKVWAWMNDRIPNMFLSAVEKLEKESSYVLEIQSKDPKDALRCYPRRPEDGRIDWTKSAEDILRLINASGPPYSGAFTFLEEAKVVIVDAQLVVDGEVFCAIPGQITHINHGGYRCIVSTGAGKLGIQDYLMEGSGILTSVRARFR
jgi:methionyl-tRNA formyltransferase